MHPSFSHGWSCANRSKERKQMKLSMHTPYIEVRAFRLYRSVSCAVLCVDEGVCHDSDTETEALTEEVDVTGVDHDGQP